MAHLARPVDRLAFCELHPEDAQALRSNFRRDARVKTHEMDGYTALKAMLPPKEKRGWFGRRKEAPVEDVEEEAPPPRKKRRRQQDDGAAAKAEAAAAEAEALREELAAKEQALAEREKQLKEEQEEQMQDAAAEVDNLRGLY